MANKKQFLRNLGLKYPEPRKSDDRVPAEASQIRLKIAHAQQLNFGKGG
jgi:hypothetical protein